MSNFFVVDKSSVYNNILEEAMKNKQKIFIKFGATWCVPCERMEPYFKDISKKYKNAIFVSLIINNDTKLIAKLAGVSVIPDFGFIHKNKYKRLYRGSNPTTLENVISLYII